jgi:hypothetical protein
MSSVGHFSVQFAGLEECPEPFRDRLRHFLSPSEAVFEIIYSPAFVPGRLCLPASVFCVTNRQWIMSHESKKLTNAKILVGSNWRRNREPATIWNL